MLNQFTYNQIFSDDKFAPERDKYGYGQFIRVSVFVTNEYFMPVLFRTEAGMNYEDGWSTVWTTSERMNQAEAIRHAIKVIDSYVFPEVKVEAV